ncbi:entericidin, EcnA/B family [Actibacterium sp. MT2.3-13A]|nr:entericidin, EcnA/B family [Actibacterium sp. MT2.3-13A]
MIRIALIILALGLAGCGTVEGMGEDIAAGARSLRNAF